MNKIASFCKDHDALRPGFYASGSANGVTTFDLRFARPNAGEYLATASAHSIEHLLATTLRNSERKDDIVYFGPMGCRTGFYLLTVRMTEEDARALVAACIERALALPEVPGAQKAECGNYLDHDLAQAKADLSRYLRLLEQK